MGLWGPYKLDLLMLSDCCCFEGKGVAIMSNAEQASQRSHDCAAELQGRLRLVRGISHQIFFIEDPLLADLCQSGGVGVASLALLPVTQMGLPAEFPTHTTSVPSNHTWSFSLSLGCIWHPQVYFFCHIKYETVWEGKSPLILGGCGYCSCPWALETCRACWKQNNSMGVGYCAHVCQTDFCLYQDWFILWLKKGNQKLVKSFCHVHLGVSSVL